jgi:peroxiredoxin
MKSIYYLLISAAFAGSCSSEPHFTLSGRIEGADSITFLLKQKIGGKLVTIDSAFSRKGSFKMKGRVEYPDVVILVALNTDKRTSFYIENSRIYINGKLDSLHVAKVRGSKTEDELQGLIALNRPLSEQYSNLMKDYPAALKENDTARISRITRSADSIASLVIALQNDFIRDNPASYVTPSVLRGRSYDMDAEELEAAINRLDTNVARVTAIKELKERIAVMKTVAIGQKAPDFTMNDINGVPVSLSSLTGSGLLLIDFWASWCNPCRRENPNVVRVFNYFREKGFNVLGVSLDQNAEAWKKAVNDDKLAWVHVSDLQYWNNAAAKLYAVNSIPSNFLLDKNGTIIATGLTGEDLFRQVRELLGQ